MVRMAFPPRPPGAVGMFPTALRPPIPGIRAPVMPPIIRPATVPNITPTEKPQTTVYIGKIASTIENDFMLSILQLCGPVRSWKRPQDTTSGTLKGFGFCEFESAEGVLRALRLLSKLNVDGQELMLNVDEATKKYLCCYVENKEKNSENLKASENEAGQKEHGGSLDAEKSDTQKPSIESPKSDTGDTKKEDNDPAKKDAIVNFGILNNQDREADREAVEKLTGMIEERLKTRPPPPPPPPLPSQATADGLGNSNSDLAAISDVGMVKNDATNGKNDDEMNSESKPRGEQDRPETSSPDRSRRHDRRSKDRERDLKRVKERELERYEREREQERLRREREMEYKIREDERRFKARVKDWESRERKKKRLREEEEEIAKERKQDREWVIQEQESENDDTYSKRRKYKSSGEERTRRIREKEEDLADRLKEEEETAEATSRAQEEERQWKEREKESLELLAVQEPNGNDTGLPNIPDTESKNVVLHQIVDHDSGHDNHIVAGGKIVQNGSGDELSGGSVSALDMLQVSNAPARKLGFGLVGSGKRTTVPSVFNQEEDEDAQKEKKMRPLVPIDYSTDELQAVQTSASGALSPNLAAAAEFAKRISNANPKEERFDAEKEKVRRSVERSSQHDRDRHHKESNRRRDESREILVRDRDREHKPEKLRTADNQKLLDAKQLIDMIPKTKDELFSYDINWAIYDKNKLHERMRPWISKKITEFLGEEEETLVSYIVSSTQEHVKASEMLERLQAILDDEAEMFVLKMWRMLIFEIKRVESGLASRSKS